MGLQNIADGVMAYVAARVEFDPGVLSYSVGTREKFKNHKPPRVIFEPGDEDFTAPRKLVAGAIDNEPIATCVTGVTVYIWGRTVAEIEILRQALVVGCRDAAKGFDVLVGGQWREAEGMVTLGELYTLRVRFPVPQCRAPATFATIIATGLDSTGAVLTDGVLEGGE